MAPAEWAKAGGGSMKKNDLLKQEIKHVDIKAFDATPMVMAMKHMSFTARDTYRAAEILEMMVKDESCTNMLCIAGSTSAGGCMQVYVDMIKSGMVDAVVSTGAAIVDMDFFEALGFRHYQGTSSIDDTMLRKLYIDRIYDTFIDE